MAKRRERPTRVEHSRPITRIAFEPADNHSGPVLTGTAMGAREIEEYKKTSVASATPLDLVLMLYDSAILHCEQALAAMRAGNLPSQHEHLTKAQRLISELACSLNMGTGGEIAKNLLGVYTFCINALAKANTEDDTQPVENVRRMLCELREAWHQVRNSIQKGNTNAS